MINVATLTITPEFLNMVAEIDEFKGEWRALGNLSPGRLSRLQRVATIESIGSSTRIEGSRLSDAEVAHLLDNLQIHPFSDRDEEEVAGYASVMQAVLDSWTGMPLSEGTIRQLHRMLLQHSTKDDWHRGNYKTASNSVVAFDQDGRHIGVVFQTAEPFDTPRLMEELVIWTNQQLVSREFHPLLVIGVFVVVFLEIHPFQDGNGRLSRILPTLLLLRSGYAYVAYSSLESVIEQSKTDYYRTLRQAQPTIRTSEPDWQPWLSFFLHTLQQQVARLKAKAEREHLLDRQLSPLDQQIIGYLRDHGQATAADLATATASNPNTLKVHLRTLLKRDQILRHGTGRGTWYSLP